MKPLVIQLQEDLVTGNRSVEELLRLAKLIASKLQLAEIEHWIRCEITGYRDDEKLPEYRMLFALNLEVQHPYHGWIPVSGFSGTPVPVRESISELERFLKRDVVLFQPGKRFNVRGITDSGMLSGMPQRAPLSTTSFRGIIENVRNRLLDWTLELEKKGVLGENMSFNKNEKQIAQNITVNNIEKFTGILGNVSQSQFAIYDYSSIHKTVKECGVPQEQRNQLEEIMDGLKEGDPKEKDGWTHKAKDWIVKNQDLLGASASIVRKALGLELSG